MKRIRGGKALALIGAGLFLLAVLLGIRLCVPERKAALPPTGSGQYERPEPVPRGPVRAMWVWDARTALDAGDRSTLLAFCRRREVDTLYLSAYDLRSPMDQEYREFNRLAHRAGLTVHALAGDPRWGKPQYHHVPLEWVESVRRFNAGAPAEERFDGVHSDVEPYLLSKSWKEHPEALLGGYLDLNAKIADLLREDPLLFGVDIPFWFDDDTSYRISWRGAIKAPSQHVLDTVDTITVMAYRNFAEGSDGTVRLVSLELAYADTLLKPVVIGQETQENLYPAYVTFGGTSCEALHGELTKIKGALGHRVSFGGFAIHHYESYRKLCGD